jgi:hypothetical protein
MIDDMAFRNMSPNTLKIIYSHAVARTAGSWGGGVEAVTSLLH